MKKSLLKTLLFMPLQLVKYVSIVCLTTTLIWAAPTDAQEMSKVRVSITVANASLPEIFSAIEKATDFEFNYDKRLAQSNIRLSITKENETVAKILQYVSANSGLSFKQQGSVIAVNSKNLKTSNTHTSIDPIKITGKVTDGQNGEALPGVNVIVKGTSIGVVTDKDGVYAIDADNGSTKLIFSFIGYNTEEIEVGERSIIDVSLLPDITTLQEVVVIGYGSVTKDKVTGAIEKVSSDQIRDVPVANFAFALTGKSAGVQVSQNTGAPGGGLSIKVRGINTLTSGTQPLYVVDGVPLFNSANALSAQAANGYPGYTVDMLSNLNSMDIESVEVLKDAASQAIYGSRGSNGVVLITTKSGKGHGKSRISFDTYMGVQQLAKKVDVANAYEFANFTKLSRDNLWFSLNPTVNKATDPNDSRNNSSARYANYIVPYLTQQGLPSTDWQDVVYRDAGTQNYNLAFSGETDKSNFYISGSYLNQDGIIRNSGLKRYALRANFGAELNKVLSFGTNLNLSYTDNQVVQSEGAWFNEGIVVTTLMYAPNLPAFNADGSPALGGMLKTSIGGQSNVALIENPLAVTQGTKNNLGQTSLLANAFVNLKITESFSLRTSIGTNINSYKHDYYRSKYLNYRLELAPTASNNLGWQNDYLGKNWISETSLNYNKTFNNKHNLAVLLNYAVQKDDNARTYAQGINFPNDNVTTINAALTTSSSSDASQSSLISLVSRVGYSYQNKYILSASLRRDGSSRFGINSKWALFPSVSVGWNVNEESFFPKSNVLSALKVRASYGLTGNNDIANYGSQALLATANYAIGNSVVSGLAQSTSPNPNVSWETTSQLNAGFNASFLRNRLSLVVDYFHSETKDLLLNVTVPASAGFSSSLQNVGKIQNDGLEITIGGDVKAGKFNWLPSFNISTTKNKVVSLANNQTQFTLGSPNGGLNGDSFIVKVGESIGNFYGYKVNGIFQNTDQLNATPRLSNQRVGDFIYDDTNQDGKLDATDRTIIGNYLPKYTFGFSNTFTYGNFDLNVIIQGAQNFSVLNAMNRYLFEGWGNVFRKVAVGSFVSESQPGSDGVPRPVWGIGSNSHTVLSSWHIEDASYVRFRNITLGYTFKEGQLKKAGIAGLRVYASALNPFTITNYQGYNPEVSHNGNNAIAGGVDFGNYPIAKSFIVGLNLKF